MKTAQYSPQSTDQVQPCPPSWTSLVPVQPCGSRPPFFYVPPAGCTALDAAKYARSLGKNQPVYGLQPLGFEEGEVPHNRVEDMAAYYLGGIRTLQPEGPYYIGGTCFGAYVAFEMALQLQAQGCIVGLLAMFDPGPPHCPRTAGHQQSYAEKIVHYASRSVYHLQQGQFFRVIMHLFVYRHRSIFKRAFYFLLNTEKYRITTVLGAHQKAQREYTPHLYRGKTVLFRSGQYHDEEQKGEGRWARNWSEFAGGDFHCHVIQGTHMEVLGDPQFQKLAEQFKMYLEENLKYLPLA